MTSNKKYLASLLFAFGTICPSCQVEVNEDEKIFHAGPLYSDYSGAYFSLYKGNKYQFCDGDLVDSECYTGNYRLLNDTIVLHELAKLEGIPGNRFLIRHYSKMDSSYWQWKYPGSNEDWERMRHMDVMTGATGDVLPLNQQGEIVFDRVNYFVIRQNELKNSD